MDSRHLWQLMTSRLVMMELMNLPRLSDRGEAEEWVQQYE